MTDLPAAAITALEQAMLAHYPKAELYDPGTGFRWQTFLDVLKEAWPAVLEAAAPHLAADPTTESEGFRAYKAGVAAGRAEGAAAERQAIIRAASQLRAAIPADHPAGAQASFADYLRVTSTP